MDKMKLNKLSFSTKLQKNHFTRYFFSSSPESLDSIEFVMLI